MNIARLYSGIAPFYGIGLTLIGYAQATSQLMCRLPFRVDAPITVLDAGCGTGLYSLAILQRFPQARIIAFDISPRMLEIMRGQVARTRNGNRVRSFVDDIQGPLEELTGETFDLIVTGGVLEHVEIERTVENLSRFLSVCGYFLNAPTQDNVAGRTVGRLYGFEPYPRDRNIKAFEGCGLHLQAIVRLPRYTPISLVKEIHIFRKMHAR